MIKPTPHLKEEQRIEELNSFNILDTLPEQDYDFITNMAAKITGSPISLISLLDDKRQWFKSRHGLNVSETPKDFAFCAHAINDTEEVFIIRDSTKDERFHDNPLVIDSPEVIFYAGVSLRASNNLPLGTLCVIDHKPKDLSIEQINDLKSLGRQVMTLLNLRKSNQCLKEVKQNFEKAQELTQIGSWKWDMAKDKANWSDEMYKIYGVSKNDFYPSNENVAKAVIPDDREKLTNGIGALINNGMFSPFDFRIQRPNGEIRDLHIIGLDKTSETTVFGVTQDVTNRKMLEKEILAQNKLLAERETLLKEVHHRVKNNMQVISSLINLQAMKIKDAKLLSIFKEAESRILSMALIHEQIYDTENLSEINFGNYLSELYTIIASSYNTNTFTIKLHKELENIYISMDNAIPCGLIFNEVLTNIFKYAFIEKIEGTISLKLKSVNNKIELLITDNGRGFDTSLDTNSLGIRLIKSLSKQINGESEITSNKEGTTFKLCFPSIKVI